MSALNVLKHMKQEYLALRLIFLAQWDEAGEMAIMGCSGLTE